VYDALTYKQLSWLVDNLENSVTMNSYKLSVCELIFISLILKVTNKLLSKTLLGIEQSFCDHQGILSYLNYQATLSLR
ncbi:hypothetical protein AB4328_18665, partial [Vibrio breoganii]